MVWLMVNLSSSITAFITFSDWLHLVSLVLGRSFCQGTGKFLAVAAGNRQFERVPINAK